MKRIFIGIIVVGLAFVNDTAFAQIELNAYAGYVPSSKTMYSYNGYRLRIEDGANYGISLGYVTPYGIVADLSYMRFSSYLKQDGGIYEVIERQPINVEYYQLGFQKPFQDSETLVPYGLFSLGASRFNPTEQVEDYWRFAINLGVGVKYFFSEKVGIKVQARMMMPLYFGGAGFGCSIGTGGSGCGAGIGMGSEIIQGDFTGGVVLRLGSGS